MTLIPSRRNARDMRVLLSKELAIAICIALVCACIAIMVMIGATYSLRVQWPSGMIEMKPARVSQGP